MEHLDSTSNSSKTKTHAAKNGTAPSATKAAAASPAPTAKKNDTATGSAKNGNGGGSVRWRRGKAEVRLSLGPLGRKNFSLLTCKNDRQAEERRALLAELAGRLLAANRIERGLPLLEQAASAEGRDLALVSGAVDLMCKGETLKTPTAGMTFQEVAESWLNGDLTRQFPDYIKPRKQAKQHLAQLKNHVFPVIPNLPMARFTLEHAQEIMRLLPKEYSAGSRRMVALQIHRIVALAVFPLRILTHSPLPRGFVPPAAPRKAMACLYPDEDARLLGCREIPLCDRILYGFLDREGMRADEAFDLEWSDVDLERGAIALDKNKTNDARAWALSPDVVRALRVWRKLRETNDPKLFRRGLEAPSLKLESSRIFRRRGDLAARLRDDLKRADVTREILFEHNESRQQLRAHDLRATFITIGLANGRTEAWIMDRTGHRSSVMVNCYRRAARTFTELGLGTLKPLDEAIPEITESLAAERASAERAAASAAAQRDEDAHTQATSGAPADSAPNAKMTEPAPFTKKSESRGAVTTAQPAGSPKTSAPGAKVAGASGRGEATVLEEDRVAPQSKTPTAHHADHGSAASSETAHHTAATAPHKKQSRGTMADVSAEPARWSLAGPTVPEGPRADPTPSKNAGKTRRSAPLGASAPISK